MARTWKKAKHPWKDSASWRKEGNRAYRARWRQLMREGEYVLLGHPKRDRRGWYW